MTMALEWPLTYRLESFAVAAVLWVFEDLMALNVDCPCCVVVGISVSSDDVVAVEHSSWENPSPQRGAKMNFLL